MNTFPVRSIGNKLHFSGAIEHYKKIKLMDGFKKQIEFLDWAFIIQVKNRILSLSLND